MFPRKWTKIARELSNKFDPKVIKYRALVLIDRKSAIEGVPARIIDDNELNILDDETTPNDFGKSVPIDEPSTEQDPPESSSDSEIAGDDDFSYIVPAIPS